MVIHIIPNLEVGGAQKLMIDIIENIDRKKFDVKIITVFAQNWDRFRIIALENNIDILSLSDANKKINKFQIMLQACRMLIKIKPNVVHTHLNSIIYVLPAVFISGVKRRVHTFHSIANRSSKGVYGSTLRIALKLMNFTPVAVGETVRRSISETYGIKLKNIYCIYNGVDRSKFYPKKDYNSNGCINFINVGSIYHVKNPELLLESFVSALDINPNMTLTFVGDGEQKKHIESQVNKLGLNDKVFLLGNRSEVGQLLRKSDIYISASNIEGVPLSVLEAMSSGLPIISTRAGGVVDIVSDNINGVLTEVGNKEELVQAILRLANSSKMRQKMSKESIQLSSKYDIKETVLKYENLYT